MLSGKGDINQNKIQAFFLFNIMVANDFLPELHRFYDTSLVRVWLHLPRYDAVQEKSHDTRPCLFSGTVGYHY